MVQVPAEFTRAGNTDHQGKAMPIPDTMSIQYGTAGFRMKAELLPFVVYRVGCLAALRAKTLNKTIGVMITASHNPEQDNGVKVVDPMGEMLAADWEKRATALVNTPDTALAALLDQFQAEITSDSSNAAVVCGMDTRVSGPYLTTAAQKGIEAMGVKFTNHGVLTTPQLHFIVKCENDKAFGTASEEGYYQVLISSLSELLKMCSTSPSKYDASVNIDGANGVGALKMRVLESRLPPMLKINYVNESGRLNHDCGADFVKIGQTLPANFDFLSTTQKAASFDGDADRLIYFKRIGSGDKKAVLLDGDRIAVLFAKYFHEQLVAAGLTNELSMGIVQTAYANGNSSKYIKEKLGLTPVFVPTGVKHLHHAALNYDIGIYFEANGHGTVVFSDKFDRIVRRNPSDNVAVQRLHYMSRLINEVVGDAIADLLAVEMMLYHFDWSVQDWLDNTYVDAPSVQLKVPVGDRSIYKTTFDETQLLEPHGMQSAVDALVAKCTASRSFVRPSGTENIVRVYAEASTAAEAKALADEVAALIKA